jgi:hypothetical protein
MTHTEAAPAVRAQTAETIRALVRRAPAPVRQARVRLTQTCEAASAVTAEADLEVGGAAIHERAAAGSVPAALELVRRQVLRRLDAITPER